MNVEFQRNGERMARVEPEVRDIAVRVLRGTGVFSPVDRGPDGEVRVVLNNVADRGAAAAQGFGTGLTLGAVGTTVTDRYEMSVAVTTRGAIRSRTGIKHAIHTAIGNTRLPPGTQTTTVSAAFQRVVEAMLLQAVADMQRSGELDAPAPLVSQAGLAAPQGS